MDNLFAHLLPPPSIFTTAGNAVRQIVENGSQLREVQKDALHGLETWFTNSETTRRTAVVVMPTGAGKTGVMCCLPYYLASTSVPVEGLDFSKPVLFIAPDRSIFEQLVCELSIPSTMAPAPTEEPKPFLIRRGIIPDNVHTWNVAMPTVKKVTSSSELCEYLNVRNHVVVTNAQKWHNGPTAVWPALKEDSFSLVIVDEAHHLPADQWQNIVEKFQAHARVVFFTATPFRADKRNICDDIKTVGYAYHLSREEAIRKKIIRQTKFTVYPTNPMYTPMCSLLQATVQLLMHKDANFPLPHPYKHVAMIAIGPTVNDALNMAEMARSTYSDLGVVAMHRDLKAYERKKAMEEIKNGRARIIIIVKMLLEGFDHPPVSIAAICTNIRSPVKYAQFIGRAQRVIPDENNIEADVISLDVFNQQRNHDNFTQELLISPTQEAETELDD